MKVLLYFENQKAMRKSGIGRALIHQKKSLELNGIEYTTNPKDSFDVAHINTYFLSSLMVLKKCKKKNIPVIVHGHSTKEDFRNSFAFWWLAKPFFYKMMEWVYSKADLIITPTPYSKGLIENYSYVKCPVMDCSNGIDVNKYDLSLSLDEKVELRNRFNIKEGQKLVVGIGWTFERKGTHDFIELAKSFPDTKFIWFGNKNKLSNTRVINEAIKNKSDNCLLPGYVEQEVIIKMLHMADCFLFPSYEETEGIVVLEALATKTPVIVRNIGALSYLSDGVNAMLANNNEEFKEKINYALNNDCSHLVENGYKLALDRDLINVGRKLKDYYLEVIGK